METMEALALVGGQVEEELLIKNEYLALKDRTLLFRVKSIAK
jgi:hypothetical protein